MKLNKIYYINLLERTDRLFFCKEQLKLFKEDHERINAVKHENGRIGCALSHLKILQEIYNSNEEGYFLILEDDFFLKQEIDFSECILKMKEYNSPIFCLSYTYEKKIPLDKNYVRLLKSYSTCAYLFHYNFIPNLIYNFKQAIQEKNAIDVQWNQLQKDFLFLGYKYPLILQLPSFSNITNKETFSHNNSYIILEPTINDIGMFFFEFSTVIELSIRYKKFLFIENWEIYNPFFKMSFFPPKKLKRKNEIKINNFPNTLENGKNYLFKRGFLKKINSRPSEDISYFLKLNDIETSSPLTIAVNIYFHNDKELLSLPNTNYFKKGLHMVRRNYPDYKIDIYTNKINFCKKIWGKSCSYFLSNNNMETILKLVRYRILILGNDPVSWWSGIFNKFIDRELYFPKEWYSIRKEPPFPFYSKIIFFSIYNITYIIFDFLKEDIKLPRKILDRSIPLIIVTPYPEKYKENYNILIKPLSRNLCTFSSLFPEKSDLEIYEMEKLKIIYLIIQENPYHTLYFSSVPSTLLQEKYSFMDSKNYSFNNEKYLYKEKIQFITFPGRSKEDAIMISTKKSIQDIHDRYYRFLEDKKEIPKDFFNSYHYTNYNKTFQYHILLLLIPCLILFMFLLQR